MFSPGELAAMTAEVAQSIGPGSGLGASIVLLRGGVALPAQNVRLVRPGGQGQRIGATDGTESSQAELEVVGLPALDIRARDRFKLDGLSYEVIGVQPQRKISTVATARLVQ